jgi:hypothetical protein
MTLNKKKKTDSYPYHLLPQQTIFKNECINIFPTFDVLNFKKSNEDDEQQRSCLKLALTKDNDFPKAISIVSIKARSSEQTNCTGLNRSSSLQTIKKSFLNSPGLDVGLAVEETQKKIKKSCIGTWQLVTKSDINSIWSLTSNYIRERLCVENGTTIPNLGTFGVYKHDVDVGNGILRLSYYPYFSVDLNFAKTHNLNYVSKPAPYHSPCSSINYLVLTKKSFYPRDIIQRCLELCVLAISNKIRENNGTILVHFPTLGTMIITNDLKLDRNRTIRFELCPGLLKSF